ncbi:MAG TPA: alpha-amylase family glycosyl hydrolase, partial [Spirochaetia bacterium]|nr:alpha-amylase family glycosyl hydrolase [Spirochaetia bacterium]
MSDHREIATAPGDLPASEIVRRHQSVHRQFRHENTTTPLAPRPGDEVVVMAYAGVGAAIDRAVLRYTTDGSLPGQDSAVVAMRYDGAEWSPFAGGVGRWVGRIPAQSEATVVRYRIDGFTADERLIPAQDGQGFWYRYPPETGVTVFAYQVRGGPASPPWLAEAVVYQIFVDRFRRSSGAFLHPSDLQAKHGGELSGVIDALPYLEELGVNCIWLSPVGPAPSYHRYDTTDYFAVDPILGDLGSFRRLTTAAHERNMRVILDFVPSHLSVEHPAFTAATASPDAETRDWFIFYRWPHEYRSFLDLVPSLVSLNTSSEGVREFLLRSARFWVECGVDGFRLDHVIGHGMDFWVEFQRALEQVDPNIVTIGEATDTSDALKRYRGRTNSILDFPLARALRLTFATGQWDLAEFDSFLHLYDDYMTDG